MRRLNTSNFIPDASAITAATIVTAAFTLGYDYAQDRSLGELFSTPWVVLSILGFGTVLSVLIARLFSLLDRVVHKVSEQARQPLDNAKGFLPMIAGETGFVGPMLVILSGWLPYLVSHFPGSLEYDVFWQLDQMLGIYLFSNAHPVLSTLIIYDFANFGHELGVDNLGIFLYILLQSVVLAFSFAFTLRTAARWRIARWARISTLLLMALLPLWGFVAQFGIKDVLYMGFVVCLSIMVWIYLLERETANKRSWYMWFGVIAVLVCCLRNNGVFLAVAAPLLMIRKHRKWGRLMALSACILLVYILWVQFTVHVLNAANVPTKEALSLPLQQTARAVKEHGDDITAEEKEAISRVLQYDVLAASYMDWRADNIKNAVISDLHWGDLQPYLATWGSMFLKYPHTYLEAFVGLSYAYWYPFAPVDEIPLCRFNTQIEQNPIINTGYYDFHQLDVFAGMREFLLRLYNLANSLPVLGWLQNIGVNTYLVVLTIAFLWHRKQYPMLAGCFLPMISICVCLASPVNGMLRYFIPVMATLPVTVMGAVSTPNTMHVKEPIIP